jgi:hypothetical protein
MKDSSNNEYKLGTYKDGLFQTDSEILKLDTENNNTQYSLTSISSDRINYNKLIHNRFAHINDAYINIAINKKLITGVAYNFKTKVINGVQTFAPGRFKSPFCESCIMAKSTRISSTKTPGSSHRMKPQTNTDSNNDSSAIEKPKKHVRFSESLDFKISSFPELTRHSTLHSDPTIIPPALSKLAVDIKGPLNTADKSHHAKRYALIFTCITTRFRFVAFLKAKDEAVKYTQKLLHYIRSIDKNLEEIEQQSNDEADDSFFTPAMKEMLATNEVKSHIKPFSEMKSDNGTEFVNADMEELLDQYGVFHSTTSPYTPHQNAIAERSNRTIFDLAAACMHACGIAIKHWTHAVAYVVHTLNQLPNKALNLVSTPYIQLFKKVPDVSYFRTFGCDSYMVLPEHKRPSFGLRAVKGIFVGYCHPFSLAYKVLYNGTIYQTGHVYFNEDLSILPQSEVVLTDSINKFFNQIQDTSSITSTETEDSQITPIAQGEAIPQNPESSTGDPSDRKIQDTKISDIFEPVSKRTRKPTDNIAAQQAILIGQHFHNNQYDLTSNEIQTLSSIVPKIYAFISLDTITIEEAMSSDEWPRWQEAMQAELAKLASINTWEEIHELPSGRKALLYKWVLKKKYDIYNKLIYKARLTVKGCSQRPGIDFTCGQTQCCSISS